MKKVEDYRIAILDEISPCEDDMDRVVVCQVFMERFAKDQYNNALEDVITKLHDNRGEISATDIWNLRKL